MKKFLAVVKHEYKKIVLKWSFLIGTLIFPVIAIGFTIIPAFIFSMQGEPTRIAVVDPTGKVTPRLKENLSAEKLAEKTKKAAAEAMPDLTASQEDQLKNSASTSVQDFVFTDYNSDGKSDDQIRRELTGFIADDKLDAYLIVPENFAESDAKYEFYSRKSGDFVVNSTLQNALNDAVRSQRLADANISEDKLENLSRRVNWSVKKIDESGAEKEGDNGFFAGFAIAMMIYLMLAIYGQLIMSTVVEEKETRVAEILFSSAKPFELMMGKLVGVGLAGLTQLAIWITSVAALIGVISLQLVGKDFDLPIPAISPLMVVYFLIFFLLGFFIYASIFALIGSMVTTVQEGGQFAFIPILLMLGGFYFSFAIIRDPNSTLSFWASILPFVAPMTMPVRIMGEMPPFWHIALAIFINLAFIAFFVWLASRVYRVGMLMYGKKATIPEVWKWIRQS